MCLNFIMSEPCKIFLMPKVFQTMVTIYSLIKKSPNTSDCTIRYYLLYPAAKMKIIKLSVSNIV